MKVNKKEKKSKELLISEIKVPAGYTHPEAPNIALPKHEFTMGIIAPKGCGKTTTICNMLQFYKGYFNTILVFSPTVESDEKWDVVKKQILTIPNNPLKAFLQSLINRDLKKKNGIVERPAGKDSEYQSIVDKLGEHTGYIREEDFYDDYDDGVFEELMEEQRSMIRLLKSHDQPKYLANRILVIFDDLVGSTLFKSQYFRGFNTRHRHYGVSVMMVSQGYKEIPKTIRTNWTALMVFEIGNEREVYVIYEEFSMGLSYKDWLEVYRYCTKEEYAFMFINFQRKRPERIMRNFSEYVNSTPTEDVPSRLVYTNDTTSHEVK